MYSTLKDHNVRYVKGKLDLEHAARLLRKYGPPDEPHGQQPDGRCKRPKLSGHWRLVPFIAVRCLSSQPSSMRECDYSNVAHVCL